MSGYHTNRPQSVLLSRSLSDLFHTWWLIAASFQLCSLFCTLMTAGPPSQMCGWNSALLSAQPPTPPNIVAQACRTVHCYTACLELSASKAKNMVVMFHKHSAAAVTTTLHREPDQMTKFAPPQKKSSEIATSLAWQSCRTQRGKFFVSVGCLTLQNVTLLTLCCFPIKTPQCKTAAYFTF